MSNVKNLKPITTQQILAQNKISKMVFGEIVTNRGDDLTSAALQSNEVKAAIETYKQKLKNELTEELIEDNEWLEDLGDIDEIEFIKDVIHYSIKHSILSFDEENKLGKIFLPKDYGWFFGEELMTVNEAFMPVVYSLSKIIEDLYETANLDDKNTLSLAPDLIGDYEFDYFELKIEDFNAKTAY